MSLSRVPAISFHGTSGCALHSLPNDQKLLQNRRLGFGVFEELGFLLMPLEFDRQACGLQDIEEMRIIAHRSTLRPTMPESSSSIAT